MISAANVRGFDRLILQKTKHFSREFLATTKKHHVWKAKGIVELAGERDARKMDENVKIIERKREMIRRRFCARTLSTRAWEKAIDAIIP